MCEEKEINGVSFPTPETMRKITAVNKETEKREELLEVRGKMKAATDCFLTVKELSAYAQDALISLGYDVTVYTDQYGTILYYKISWEPKSQDAP